MKQGIPTITISCTQFLPQSVAPFSSEVYRHSQCISSHVDHKVRSTAVSFQLLGKTCTAGTIWERVWEKVDETNKFIDTRDGIGCVCVCIKICANASII